MDSQRRPASKRSKVSQRKRAIAGRRRWLWLLFSMLAGTLLAPIAYGDAPSGEKNVQGDWVAGDRDPPQSMSQPRYAVSHEQAEVALRDGTSLKANLFLPMRQLSDDVGPCVVSTNGYAPPSDLGETIFDHVTGPELADLAERGYAGAFVFLRSETVPGDEALYYRYAEDGYDIVEWMAAQPWCNGKVGMVGASLSGISQWLAAGEAPPSLAAIVPKVACGDCYWNLWYRGGMLPGKGRKNRQPPIAAYDEHGAAIAHRDYDAWWRERDTDTDDHRALAVNGIAVLHLGGWDDYIHTGGFRAVEEVLAAGGQAMLIIGPWEHDTASTTQTGLEPYNFQTFTVLWFDRFLKGIDNGIDDREALLYVEGAGKYRFEEEWPIRNTRWTSLYLRASQSGSADSINDGTLEACTPEEGEALATYEHDPAGSLNHAGGGGARPREDQRADEKTSLTWSTAILTAPAEVTGWPRLDFRASSTAADTDFVVELSDVAPDGTSTQVTRGWLNGPRFFSRSDPPPLVAGRIYQFTLELSPMSYVFAAGHRMRISLSGSDSPGTAVNPEAATVKVFQDVQRRSRLELPVVGTGWQELESCPSRNRLR